MSPLGMGMDFQCASPSNTSLYCLLYCAVVTEERTVDSISCGALQRSLRNTGFRSRTFLRLPPAPLMFSLGATHLALQRNRPASSPTASRPPCQSAEPS